MTPRITLPDDSLNHPADRLVSWGITSGCFVTFVAARRCLSKVSCNLANSLFVDGVRVFAAGDNPRVELERCGINTLPLYVGHSLGDAMARVGTLLAGNRSWHPF